jgi:hypothetical protein
MPARAVGNLKAIDLNRMNMADRSSSLYVRMFQYFMGTKSRATLAYDTFAKWVDSYLEFLKIAERRALKVSPAYKQAWQNAFRLQRLLQRRQTSRFKYLFAGGKLDFAILRSLDNIAERLDKGWTAVEEADLRECNAAYRNESRAIEDINSKWDPHALDDARQLLENDSKYREARLALAERSRNLELS